MRTTRKFSVGIVGAAALALGVLASAQTTPPEKPKPPTTPGQAPPTTPPSTTPPRTPPTTPPPTTPPSTTPPRTPPTTPPPAKPETPASSAVRPQATDALAVTLAEDTIQFYKDAEFKDTVTQIDGVAKSNKANAPIDLKEGLGDSLSSIRWNLSPGVIVILYEDPGAKGEQFILFGSGQTNSLSKFDFDNKASTWAWSYVGGVTNPPPHIKAGMSTMPLGCEPASSTVPDNSIQLFKSKDFEGNSATISNVTSQPLAKLNPLPKDLPDSMTSARWNLPPGTVVMFFQDASGHKQRAAIWGNAELADIDLWDFNDKVSRWAAYNISGAPQRVTSGER
ncbi:MAG: hypothetical protein L0Y44_08195 [Phycisphaerales bacterium]|nr:hypothetical protein [Phycisphaerales bacterium]